MSEKVTIKVERKELHLPTIALRGLVVFPNNLVHFEVGREKSIAAVEWAMANNSNVFLVAQKEMETSEPTQQDLYTYGVVAEVKQVLRVSDELPCAPLRCVPQSPKRLWRPRRCSAPSRPALTNIWV